MSGRFLEPAQMSECRGKEAMSLSRFTHILKHGKCIFIPGLMEVDLTEFPPVPIRTFGVQANGSLTIRKCRLQSSSVDVNSARPCEQIGVVWIDLCGTFNGC